MCWEQLAYYPAYEVSDSGVVRRRLECPGSGPYGKAGRVLRQHVNHNGYLRVILWDGTKTRWRPVHRLVLETFVGQCPHGMQANHRDCNKTNNALNNLEYLTPKANTQHAAQNGKRAHLVGERHHKATLTDKQVAEIRARTGKGQQRTTAAEFGCSQSTVWRIQHQVTRCV